jgi:Tfp pilus assembly protein PilF
LLRIEPSLDSIDVERGDIVRLFESVNSPLINLRESGPGETSAVVISSITVEGQYQLFVHLAQAEKSGVCVYVCEPPTLTREQCKMEVVEAVRFLESMGFRMIDRQFTDLSIMQQLRLMERLGIFDSRPSSKPDFRGVSQVVRASSIRPSRPDHGMFGGFSAKPREQLRGANPLHDELGPIRTPLSGVAPANKPEETEDPLESLAQVNAADGDLPHFEENDAAGWEDEETGQDLENSMMKLGRLLSTFTLLFALSGIGCTKLPPTNPPVTPAIQTQLDIGHEHLKQGRWRSALQVFQQIIVDSGNARDAHYGSSLAYIQLRRPQQAEEALRAAVKSDPKWSVAKNSLASLLVDRGACDEAVTMLDQVRNDIFYPTPWYADFHHARAKNCLGDRTQAIQSLQRLISGRPEFCAAYLQLAEFAVVEKQFDVAVRSCESFTVSCENNKLIKPYLTEEHSCMCAFWAGRAYVGLGDVESARSEFMACKSSGDYGKRSREALDLLND